MDHRPTLGRRGEDLAARHLRRRGWRVLARRWRGSFGGELDLVAARGRVLAVCEVKVRRRAESGDYPPVAARQRERVGAGAEALLAPHPQCAGPA
ncbi:MAG: YraN family protein, partial [Miltoncostaeaceae bacterium]